MLSKLKNWFRRPDKPFTLLNAVRALFAAHGVSGSELVPDVETFNAQEKSGTWWCQADFRFLLPDGRTLIESFGPLGETRRAMLRDALEAFARNSFHVILRGIFRNEPDEQVTVERWTIGDAAYDAFIGTVTSRGTPPGGPPVQWFETFETAVRSARLTGDLHWIRLYYAQVKQQPVAMEVLLDNEPWEAVASEMAKYPWPRIDDFYSVRFFMILKRIESSSQ